MMDYTPGHSLRAVLKVPSIKWMMLSLTCCLVTVQAHQQVFVQKTEADNFLSRIRRADPCTTDETYCERNKDSCVRDYDTEYWCTREPCPTGQHCYLSLRCFAHNATDCEDIDECASNPCQNNASCNNDNNRYQCTCRPGYAGVNCEQDKDECASKPCMNMQSCQDQVNSFVCLCGEDFTGTLCETDMCLPRMADIVFLLDGSLSQCSSTFETQRQYVKNFISQFLVNDTNTHFSVVSYSFEATIHFYLNTFTSNTSLLAAIDNITCTNGPCRVGTALRALFNVFQPLYGARTLADKYVIVLSDGLFSDLPEMVHEIRSLGLVPGLHFVSVGVGKQVLQHDLITIADNFKRVYPIINGDALNDVLHSTVLPGCPDCFSKTTDLVILMDASYDVSLRKFYKQIDVIKVLLKETAISTNGVHVAYTRFGAELQHEFSFLDNLDKTSSISAIVAISQLVQIAGPSNASRALEYVSLQGFGSNNGARSDARKMLVLLTPGPITELDRVKQMTTALNDDGVIIAAVAMGEDSDYMSLLEIASDPSLTFLIGDKPHNQPNTIRSLIGSLITWSVRWIDNQLYVYFKRVLILLEHMGLAGLFSLCFSCDSRQLHYSFAF